MRGDIAIAGYMITAQEWKAFDALARAQLCAVITRRDDAAVDAPALAIGSAPAGAGVGRQASDVRPGIRDGSDSVDTLTDDVAVAPFADRGPADPAELAAVFAALAESSLFFIADDPFASQTVIGSWLTSFA